jgi:gliding motility-associated GldM-like protein
MKLILILLFAVLWVPVWSQKVILYETRTTCKTLMENYIQFYTKGIDENSIVFKTDDGSVSQIRNTLIFKTNKPGIAKFKVYRKKKGKLLLYDSVEILVYENKYAEALIGVKKGGLIDKKQLIAIGAVVAGVWTRESHCDPVHITGYTVIFHKKDGTVQYQKNTGNRFNDSTIAYMNNLQPGELVTFSNIQVENEGWPGLQVMPVEFTIQQ